MISHTINIAIFICQLKIYLDLWKTDVGSFTDCFPSEYIHPNCAFLSRSINKKYSLTKKRNNQVLLKFLHKHDADTNSLTKHLYKT
jgi:hypothetical protein